MVPQDLAVSICTNSFSRLEEEGQHLLAVRGHYTQDHDLGWMLGPEGVLNISCQLCKESVSFGSSKQHLLLLGMLLGFNLARNKFATLCLLFI